MIYVSSDWHGCPLDTVRHLFRKAGFSEADYCFVLGDVIDRGDHGVELLQWLMLQGNVELIRGNHEDMMLGSEMLFEEIDDDSLRRLNSRVVEAVNLWMYNGAQPTIAGLKRLSGSDRNYVFEYVSEAPLYECVEAGGRKFILTHSGLQYFSEDKALDDYTKHELIWNRPKITDRYFSDIFTVFGHTPTGFYGKEHMGKMVKTETWADIDTGVAMGLTPMLLRLDDMKEFYV